MNPTSLLVLGTVVSVQVLFPDGSLPRTRVVLLGRTGGETTFVLPGDNGGLHARIHGLPTLEVGQELRARLVETPLGLVPQGLGAGLEVQGERTPVWALNGNHLDDDLLPFGMYMNQEGCRDLGGEITEQVVVDGLDSWSGVGCSTFQFQYLGQTDLGVEDDGLNVLAWENDTWEWGDSVAGMTITRFEDTGDGTIRVREVDILFNGVDWAWTDGPGDVYILPPTLNAGSIVTHELGHVTGMDHEYELVSATMFYAYLGGDWQATISGDDRRGLCENYPSGTDECSIDSDCQNIDSSPRHCQEIDSVRVCEEDRDPMGSFCSRTSYNCEEACVFTNSTATDGFCSVECSDNLDCPDGWSCQEVDLVVPVDITKACYEDEPDSGLGMDSGQPSLQDSGPPGDSASDTAEVTGQACGCQAGPATTCAWLLPALLGLALSRSRLTGK